MRTTGPLVLIPCSASKLPTPKPVPARDLYTGGYHRAARRTAEALTADGGTVQVLSGRHGLVSLDTPLLPYETRITDPDAVTPAELRAQAAALGHADARVVIVLAGADYVAAAREVWPHASAPLLNLGIGQQLQRLAEIRDTANAPRRAIQDVAHDALVSHRVPFAHIEYLGDDDFLFHTSGVHLYDADADGVWLVAHGSDEVDPFDLNSVEALLRAQARTALACAGLTANGHDDDHFFRITR
ncbi:DUF6884 domain-containing protein [Streptomyces sp. SPB074]|uniref:DUF6884 domain-containing protein n=1 Tax=Streptomyces sp. (strain SPB074) TaxID=465543 RepID=UPI00017F1064|nr:DUF6884 domain-containing protein [Streptomyces sp. SPB074]EDY43965.1 serine/arginine repetitive matrix protein 1 [Streptomyces sp. SPB074]